MFAAVTFEQMHATLVYFGVPECWGNIFMHQLLGNTLVLKTVRGDTVYISMQRGLLEGSPISVLAVGLLLTHFLQ